MIKNFPKYYEVYSRTLNGHPQEITSGHLMGVRHKLA